MTKKVLLTLTCLFLICCMFCACGIAPATPTTEQVVLDQFSAQVKDAKSITADIIVKNANGTEVSKGTVVVDFESKQRTVTIKTPNTDFTGDGTAWKTQNSTSDYPTDSVTFGWKVKDFSQFTYDDQSNSCNGVIGANVVKQLGLDGVVSSAQGTVSVKLLLTGNVESSVTVNEVVISYLSVNNNAVTLNFTIQAR